MSDDSDDETLQALAQRMLQRRKASLSNARAMRQKSSTTPMAKKARAMRNKRRAGCRCGASQASRAGQRNRIDLHCALQRSALCRFFCSMLSLIATITSPHITTTTATTTLVMRRTTTTTTATYLPGATRCCLALRLGSAASARCTAFSALPDAVCHHHHHHPPPLPLLGRCSTSPQHFRPKTSYTLQPLTCTDRLHSTTACRKDSICPAEHLS